MASVLPGDIIYIILDILGDEKDYNSLFQCAISSRYFTEHALAVLYKLCDTSPVRGGGTEDEHFRTRRVAGPLGHWAGARSEQDPTIRKWALLWRSIVLSTLDQTYLPYYSYVRYLDLDDFGDLLRDPGFTTKTKEDFFTPEILDFVSYGYQSKGNKRLRSSRVYPDNDWIKIKVGTAIVKKTTSIRGISCNVPPETLTGWLDGLPLLQSLTIWSGDALSQHAGDKLRNHCPDFKQLTIYGWKNDPPRNAEADSEVFLNELRPDTLEYFEVLSYSQLGPRSIKSIGSHLNSLTELKLTSLTIETIAELPSLTAPPALKVLVLTDSIPAAPDENFYSTVTRVAEWICTCRSLRRLELRRFVDDSTLLSQVLADEGVRLTSLSLAGYTMAGSHAFHEALACQQTLQMLYLRGEGGEFPQDNELLVQAIAQLHDLRELELKDISDGFTPDHVIALTPSLPLLERLWISGDFFDDGALTAFLCLPKLQSLAIHAFSKFTADGILGFIAQLGSGNRGFNLTILNAVDSTLTEDAQTVIRDTLRVSLDGSFDYGLAQEEFSDTDSEEMSD
ncbi:hypothetical protein BO70DRAFT_364545 [Aspergillus heteromorphus CBS 117.55]|uniref:F-box domain-containing protein n=1 Tax=Aspergillus heteromorphus CBS 117.55 TaxID=1448321 RepID=A0A317VIB2_9EURO|nr:uncharacterized protein BO70DRAFT_364545 [Aspergillus heteromorphus CBS 117.55]PWY73645.1 hypothetical protein BO70DRAFT_364545 [Aspergillus heteromorphus CBS 117.55]